MKFYVGRFRELPLAYIVSLGMSSFAYLSLSGSSLKNEVLYPRSVVLKGQFSEKPPQHDVKTC